ncbi:methylated-DNA--[protein]-cysteine S-methyltransferase [Stieleria varia]|nr:methylated-DNA--[protein]-cysteine S-methyltransferase [Stieleria varia]
MIDSREQSEQHLLFSTEMGVCGIAWTPVGLTRFVLPERSVALTEARCSSRGSRCRENALPDHVATWVEAIRNYFQGRPIELNDIPLDDAAHSVFSNAVYRALRCVTWGTTTTYGALARAVGSPGAARSIGRIMGANPWPVVVPCHRVLASGGKLGGFSAPGGLSTKEALLKLEHCSVGSLPLFDSDG